MRITNAPNAASLMTTARSCGNDDLAAALAAMADNSVQAGAANVWIGLDPADDDVTVRIRDDGRGMSYTELVAALRPASRNPDELRDIGDFDLPAGDLRKTKKNKVSAKEVDLAAQLVEGMSAKWNPGKYHDEYRDVLMKLIEKKIKSGKTEVIEEPEDEEEEAEPKTINFMDVLKRSVAHASKGRRSAKKKPAKRKAAPRKRATKKKRAS